MSMMANCHHCIINISEGSPESCEAFKHNVAGYFTFIQSLIRGTSIMGPGSVDIVGHPPSR